jgi:hypothetical protein
MEESGFKLVPYEIKGGEIGKRATFFRLGFSV